MNTTLPNPNLTLREMAGIPVLTDDALFEACGVRMAFSGRAGGVSAAPYNTLDLGDYVGDDPQAVAENRARVVAALGGEGYPVVVPKQVHGTRVVQVANLGDAARAQEDAREGADAVVVTCAGVAAQLSFADCLPLVVVSPTGRFAVIHAGWRGALAGVASAGTRALAEADAQAGEACDPSTFNAYIGPYIHEECFETGGDVVDQFVERYGEGVLSPQGRVDLSRVVTTDLASVGVSRDRIVDCDICTVCSCEDYYSFRAAPDGVCGRHGALALRVTGWEG